MRRKQLLRRGSLAVVLSAVLAFSAQSSRADEWYPGLPDPDSTTGGSWAAAAQGGISYAKRAKQWFRSPMGMVTFTASIVQIPNDDPLLYQFGATGRAYFASPKGAPEPYGYMEPMTVRSVGFGLMPVEATVQVSQRRKNGYPIPVESTLMGTNYYHSTTEKPYKQVAEEAVVEDAFNVQILKVRVDGHDLQLTGDCRTVQPAPMRMSGPSYTIPFPMETDTTLDEWFSSHDASEYFHPLYGGELTGTMTIPAFTGCTTALGDDLSALMTLSVSGPDNPVSARVGWPCGRLQDGVGWPLATGQSNPKSTVGKNWHPNSNEAGGSTVDGCNGSEPFDYPSRDAN